MRFKVINYLSKIIDEIDIFLLNTIKEIYQQLSDNKDLKKALIELNKIGLLEEINKNNLDIDTVLRALKLLIFSTEYSLEKNKNLGDFFIHNPEIGKLLKSNYSANSFKKLFDFATSKGVFKRKIDHDTGFIMTTDMNSEENPEMVERVWIKDLIVNIEALKEKEPYIFKKNLKKIIEFYSLPEQITIMKNIINDPDVYHKGGLSGGVPHIFYPKSLKADPNWHNNKRLESHGLVLKSLIEAIITSNKNKGWSFNKYEIDDSMIDVIIFLAHYFKAIDYPSAQSAGNWEELPIEGGLTWDTEAIRSAYEKLFDLCFNQNYDNNEKIKFVRNKLKNREKILLNKINNAESIFDNEKILKELIEKGYKRVQKNYLAEAPGRREKDASLIFITASSIKFDKNPIKDVKKHLEILEFVWSDPLKLERI